MSPRTTVAGLQRKPLSTIMLSEFPRVSALIQLHSPRGACIHPWNMDRSRVGSSETQPPRVQGQGLIDQASGIDITLTASGRRAVSNE